MATEKPVIEEFDHLMRGDLTGLALYENSDALDDRIAEWLDTPEGSIADMPWWGNRLSRLKHEPIGINLQVMTEMSIAQKLPVDVRNIDLRGIRVEVAEIDLIRVIIQYQLGTFVGEVAL